MTAAIGMACGAGLVILALFATAAHFVAVFGYRWVATHLPRSRYAPFGLRIIYEDGRGILRDVLEHCTEQGFTIARVATNKLEREMAGRRLVAVNLEVQGQPRPSTLAASLSDLSGVEEVTALDPMADAE
jgi:putative Mg2+ transporter-C (MgtC) family protein